MEEGLLNAQPAFLVHAQQYRGYFQNGIGTGIESTGFDINHHRQVSAKAVRHRAAADIVVVVLFRMVGPAHGETTRQLTGSPARSGISWD